jgi:hypothetical protein
MILADANNSCQPFVMTVVCYVQVHNTPILLRSPNKTNNQPTVAYQHLEQPTQYRQQIWLLAILFILYLRY